MIRSLPDRSLFKGFLKQSFWLYGGMAVAQVAGVIDLAVLARSLTLVEFGQLALIIGYGSVVNALIDFRVWEAILKFFNEHFAAHDFGRALTVLRLCVAIDIGTGVVATAVLTITAKPVARLLLDDPDLADEIVLYGVMLLFTTTETTATGLFRVYRRFDLLGLKDGLGSIIRRSLSIAAALTFGSLHAVMLALVLGGLIEAVLFNGLAYHLTRRQLGKVTGHTPLASGELKRILSFVLGTNVLGTLKLLTEHWDMLLLGWFGGPSVTGVYKVAASATQLHHKLKIPITTISYPEIVRARQAGPVQLRSTIIVLISISALATLPSALVLAIFADPIIRFVSGGADYLAAADYFRIMILGNVVTGLLFWAGHLLMANERVWLVNHIHLVRSLSSVVALAVVIPTWGALGASWLYVFNQSTVSIAAFVACVRLDYLFLKHRFSLAPSEKS
ncbi:MAG: oligosaccharide flippase family protein [Chloroflexota bacterium]